MRCKIVRFQKLMWRNIMRSTKSQKASVLHYSIDMCVCVWIASIFSLKYTTFSRKIGMRYNLFKIII